jgi:hypothetical protein
VTKLRIAVISAASEGSVNATPEFNRPALTVYVSEHATYAW